MTRRLLSLICPWYVLWRVRRLAESPLLFPLTPEEQDAWDRGYERAMWEVRLNLGRGDA